MCRLVTFLILIFAAHELTAGRRFGGRSIEYRPAPRIVGGTEVKLGRFTFFGLIRYYSKDRPLCGSSIIASEWAITAAHCLYKVKDISILRISVGTIEYTDPGTDYSMNSIIIHPNYIDGNLYANDIALIKTVSPINFNRYVQPIMLASYNIGEGETVIAIGHGRIDVDTRADEVRAVKLTTIGSHECLQNFSPPINTDKQLCTIAPVGKGICRGDSGGPLISPQYQLHGIVSGSIPCALGYPDIFVRVFRYKKWISEATNFAV